MLVTGATTETDSWTDVPLQGGNRRVISARQGKEKGTETKSLLQLFRTSYPTIAGASSLLWRATTGLASFCPSRLRRDASRKPRGARQMKQRTGRCQVVAAGQYMATTMTRTASSQTRPTTEALHPTIQALMRAAVLRTCKFTSYFLFFYIYLPSPMCVRACLKDGAMRHLEARVGVVSVNI